MPWVSFLTSGVGDGLTGVPDVGFADGNAGVGEADGEPLGDTTGVAVSVGLANGVGLVLTVVG